MIDYASEVRNRLLNPSELCSALGLLAGHKKTSNGVVIRCPSHEDKDPSCTVRIGGDGTIAVKCHGCDFAGDALTLIAQVRGLDIKDSTDFREVMAVGAEVSNDAILADEIRTGKSNAYRTPTKPPAKQAERVYPEQSEVVALWESAHPCVSAPVAKALLESRAICPVEASNRQLLRVLPPGCQVPKWATSGNVPWSDCGFRMIARVVDPLGVIRSVRAWQIDGVVGPKRKPPSGCKAAGLVLANREAAKMLAGKSKPKQVVICEGEPDWVTWATKSDTAIAVIGIGSGSWTTEFAKRLPKNCDVFLRVHCDPAGDKYAEQVLETIGEKCSVWRLTPGKSGMWIDENDKAKSGHFPISPGEDCIPWNDLARNEEDNRPRVFSVRELLSASRDRVSNSEPLRLLTTGHWQMDMMVGGIRPGFTWVMGADTSWGKSAWALMLADENIKKGRKVLIVSTEDDEDIYGDRLMARRAQVDAIKIRDKMCTVEDHRLIANVVAHGEPIPFYLDARGKNFERVIHEIKSLVDSEGIDLTILDYIGECRLKKKSQDERLMFKEIAQLFRFGIKDLKKSGIILSQLTIDDPTKPPTRKNIRECKDIGSGAEGIMLGWKPPSDVTLKSGEVKYEAGSRVMIIDKAKSGKCGNVAMSWDDRTASFNRVTRPFGEDGYEIPGFEQALDDIDNSITGSIGDSYEDRQFNRRLRIIH